MNPTEREELARLLPSPGEPVLPNDRRTVLRDHLMRELTSSPGNSSSSNNNRNRTRARRRLVAVAVPLATAAAVTATALLGGSGGRPAPDQEAVDLLNRIAAVAAARPTTPVRDDQYVYVATQGTQDMEEYGVNTLRREDWQPVDGKRSGLARIKVLSGPNPFHQNGDMKLGRDPNVTYYRELEALPTDPQKLYRKIWDGTEGQGPTHEAAALEEIGAMLPSATLLPELNAALYRAAARIPGVSVVRDAEDIAGREGVGLTFNDRDDQDTWVFDKKSLKFLGTDEQALLGVGIADRIGVAPRH
ncbi:CU044_5270 family protein [Streptomyces ferrugineus]|uniref:CU044_5270 family protein n=1 Tax=Streptomyces ferrugineus TaxID=1413221 RepID=A0A7M2SPP8_9ACTN|nr:CU044_5270 family protein [Streptomyces ferrugineus]QOV37705.1 CU044_5270 family protein [Streptomyces ferrugineus]